MLKWICVLVFLSAPVLAHEHKGHGHHGDHNHAGHDHSAHKNLELETTEALPGGSIFQLESKWKSQDGQEKRLREFVSKPTVFAMAYTSCTYACPILTSTMVELEKKIKTQKAGDAQYLLLSLDPEQDTPARLMKYSKDRGFSKNWTLLTSDPGTVREMAVALGINYRKLKDGDIAHSNVIFLMDKDGVVKTKVVGLNKDADQIVSTLKGLK